MYINQALIPQFPFFAWLEPYWRCTMGQNNQKSRHEHQATYSFVFRLLAPLTHSPPHCLLCFRALLCSFTLSLPGSLTYYQACGKESFVYEMNASISFSFNPKWLGWNHIARWREWKWRFNQSIMIKADEKQRLINSTDAETKFEKFWFSLKALRLRQMKE